MKKLFVLLLMLCAAACCALEITPGEGMGYTVKAASYTAAIGSDTGNLSSLKFGGEEFLENTVEGIYSAYFFVDSQLKAASAVREGSRIISETPGVGRTVYTFDEDSVTVEATGADGVDVPFYLLLHHDILGAFRGKGERYKYASTFSPGEYDWAKNAAAMKTEGDARFWGPWNFGLQVVELRCQPGGKTMRLRFSAGKVDPEDLKKALRENNPFKALDEEPIGLYSPVDWQVFQRSDKYNGTILFSGKVNTDWDAVQYKITGKGLNGKSFASSFKPLKVNRTTGAFCEAVPAWAGGWYTVEVRVIKDKKPAASVTVERVGVGEVFVGAGQSNSTNYGQFPIKQTLDMSATTDGSVWKVANDPMLGQHDNSTGGSYYPALGDILYEEFRVPIGFASTGHGGTPIESWLPGTDLYRWMMTRIGQLGKGGFRALLWHQGEANYQTPTEISAANMTRIIKSSLYDAGWSFPWFVAKVSYHNPDNPSWPLIRAAHQQLWDEGVAMEGPDTDVLTGKMRDYDGNGIHLSPEGLKAHARLWAEKLIPYIHSCIDREK